MKYIDIYNNISNPLDDEDILDTLSEVYANRQFKLGGFYSSLVETTEKEYMGKYNPDESNKFYATAFNKWKNGIVSLTKEEFEQLKARKSYDDRLIKLRNYLKTVPDVTTEEEAKKIMSQNFQDDDLNNAMDDYRWDSTSWGTGWLHVKSRYLNGKRGTDFPITHRLYLNVEPVDIHKVANELIKKCDEYNVPYYFKFDEFGNRDDTLVVYSDTEKLPFYINMLKEIAKENPEIKSRSKRPPILTGKIDGWIGYGSEPKVRNGKRSSFNLVRSDCIEKAIDEEYEKWFFLNENKKINYQGKEITLMDYIAILSAEKEINRMKLRLANKPKSKTQEEYENYLGYNEKDIESPALIQTIYAKIREVIKLNWTNPQQRTKDIEINNKSKKITISGFIVKELKDLALPYVMKHDNAFREKVKEKIKEISKKEGIDIKKYCFDSATKDKLLEEDQINNNMDNLYQQFEIYAKKHSISAPRRKKIYESCIDYISYLKKYAKDNNIRKNKNQQQQATSSVTTTYSLKKEQIIQDLPINSKEQSRYQGIMTKNEIRESRIKLGFINPQMDNTTTYSLKKEQRILALPLYSTEESRFQVGMSNQEIKAAQKRIGTYKK